MSYYDDYSRQLARVNAMRMMLAAQNSSMARPGPQDIALDVLRRMKAPVVQPSKTSPVAEHKGPGGILGKLTTAIKYGAPGTYGLMKGAETSPGRAILDILSRPTYAMSGMGSAINTKQEELEAELKAKGSTSGADTVVSWAKSFVSPESFQGAWEGLSGQTKKTGADTLREQNPGISNKKAAVGGLALDLVGDPLNFIPGINVGAIGSKAPRGAKVLSEVEAAAKAASETGKLADSQVPIVEKILKSATPTPEAPKAAITPSINLEEISRTAQAQQLLNEVRNAPKLAYPGTLGKIQPPFKEVDDIPTPVPGKSEAQVARLAQARAVKAMILQQGDYRIGKYTVDSILNAARKTTDPARKKIAEKVIDDEVKRIVKSGDVSGLPKFAKLYGRSGEQTKAGLTLGQFTNLIRKGEIGKDLEKYGRSTDEFTRQFPLHSVDDLENVFVNNARGERVTLGKYLSDLGVQIKQVSPEQVEFVKPKNMELQLPLSKKAVPTGPKKEVPLDGTEAVMWISSLKGTLTNKEIGYLRAAKNRKEFVDRLGQLKAKTVAGDFKTLDEFIDAADKGIIPAVAVAEILNKIGVKTLKELKTKADNILKNTGEVKAKAVERFTERQVDDFATDAPVAPAEKLTNLPPRTPPNLDEAQLQDLTKALPWSVIENLVDPRDVAKYPFITDLKKAKRTSASPGQGRARNLHGWNGISQSDVFRAVVKSASQRYAIPKTAKGREAFRLWRQRSAGLYDEVLPAIAAAEYALRKEGVKIISGTDNYGLMLSLSDILESLPRSLVERHLFNPRTSVLPTELLQASDGISRALMGQVPLDLAKENAFNIFRNSTKIKTLKNADKVAGDLANALLDNSDVILQHIERNYAEYSMEVGTAVKSMTDEVIDNVVKKYANPDVSIGEAFGDFMGRQDDISKAGRKIDAPTDAYSAAKDATDVTLATVLKPGDFAEGKTAQQMTGVTTEKEAAKVGAEQAKSRSAESLELVDQTEDLGDRYQAGLMGNVFRANVPMLDKVYTMKDALGRAFVADYGHAQLHTALRVERSVTQDFARMHHGLIAQLHNSFQELYGVQAKPMAQEAFRHLQQGTEPADEAMQAAVRALKSSTDLTFGSSIDNLGGFAQRNGIFAEHLNEILDYYHAPKMFRFDESRTFVDQANIWRTWEDVEEPLELLDVMHAAMQRATVEVTLGRHFSSEFGRAAAKAPQGYVKITDKAGKSKLGRFIDTDLYYPREIVEQMRYLDDVLKGSIAGIKNPNTAAVVSKYDAIIHAWKSGLTIYRPGHHVRNLIGDVTLAFFDGVTNPAVYAKSVRILSRRSKAYDGWDGLKALEEGTDLAGATDAGATYIKVNGKRTKLTDDQIWRAAFDQGIIPDYRTLEDVAFNTQQSIQFNTAKGISLTRPTGGRARKLAGGVSQSRDHMVRIAHFLDVVQKGNFKTLDDAFNVAGARVRKWHPDGSDLTNFENRVARRTFMFYSWMRKAIPLVVETLVMKPGKALVFPKAMYALAEMNGVDLESLDNPFPMDQLFPEFITDQIIGPQFGEAGQYGGVNPGEPVSELVSQWGGSDPQHGIGGALSPVARIPIELYTGQNLGTGSSILDRSDYADSNIPGVGYIARTTGRSVTGLGEPISDVSRGNTQPGFNEDAFVNFLTGIGIRPYSKPNYIKRAELEMRNKIREGR